MYVISKQISKNALTLKFDEPLMKDSDENIINNAIKKFMGDNIKIKWFECQYVGISPFYDEESIDELVNIIESIFTLESKLKSNQVEKEPKILISETSNEVTDKINEKDIQKETLMEVTGKRYPGDILGLTFSKPIKQYEESKINNKIRKFKGSDVIIKWINYKYVNVYPFFDKDSLENLINAIESAFTSESTQNDQETHQVEKDPEILISEIPNEVLVQVTDHIYDQLVNHMDEFGKIEIFNTLKSLQKIEKNDELLKFDFKTCIMQPKKDWFNIIWKLNDEHKLKNEPTVKSQSYFLTISQEENS